MSKYRAIIFDFDGVVVDSQKFWDTETIKIYQRFLPNWTFDDDVKMRGRNLHDAYDVLVQHYGLTAPKKDFIDAITEFGYSIYESRCEILDGFLELRDAARKADLPIGMASSGEKDWIQVALKRLCIDGTFNPIVTARDVGKGKPNPAVYLEAAKQMGIDPTQCIAVEDSTNGVASAKDAGMFCIGLQHPDVVHPDDLSRADLIVSNLREVDLQSLL